jgi:hypothetical protein
VDVAYISTAISVLALFGVCVSLAFQSHQAKIAQMIGARERHMELMRLTMDHPEMDFRRVTDAGPVTKEMRIGMSMWMSHWNTMWHIKKMDEKALRFLAADLFTKRSAREWWTECAAASTTQQPAPDQAAQVKITSAGEPDAAVGVSTQASSSTR